MFPTLRNYINFLLVSDSLESDSLCDSLLTTQGSFTCLDLADFMGTDGEGISKSEILVIAENGNSIFLCNFSQKNHLILSEPCTQEWIHQAF